MSTSVTYYLTNTASAVLATANQMLANVATSASLTNNNTNLVANTLGWVELWSQGDASAQAGASVKPGPSGHGWIDDSGALASNVWNSGNWVQTIPLETTTTGTFVADIHVRVWKYTASSGTYTFIAEAILSAETLVSTSYTNAVISALNAFASGQFASGEHTYIDCLLNILTNGTTGNMRVRMASSSTAGNMSAQLVSPSYNSAAYNALQMTYDELQTQYTRIRNSSFANYLGVLGFTYYVPAQILNEHTLPGELDALFTWETWDDLHAMRTVNAVTDFLEGTVNQLSIFNVKDPAYGAVGDGVTDDTNAVQAAINAASVTSGSVVYFPQGTYLVSSTIQLYSNTAYIGTTGSYNGATIKQANGKNLPAVLASYEWATNATSSGNPVRIANLTVNANSANNTTTHGIVLMNYDSIIRECTVINCPGCGIINTSINHGGTSIGNTAVENRIEDCKVDTIGQHGIYIQDSTGAITDGYIFNCIVSNTTQDGIRVDRAAGYFIQNNHVYGIAMNGYNLNNCWDTFVTGNEVDGYGSSATPGFYAGMSAVLIGPRGSVFANNIIAVNFETNDSSNYQHLNITGGGTTDTKAIVSGNAILGGYVGTSSTTSITSGTTAACTPASMDGIFVGQHLTVGSDNITVGAVTATTFSPASNWPSNHGPSQYFISSTKSQANSTGLTYQSNSTQQASGSLCTVVSYGNRVEQYGHYSFFDGIALVGPVGVDGAIALSQSQNYQIQTITNGATITTVGLGSIIVSASSNATGVILQAGTQAGQIIVVNNEGAGNIVFAAVGTSFVSDGTADVILADSAKAYVWDAVVDAWYPLSPTYGIPNNAALTMYSDAYSTATLQLTGGTICTAQSSSAAATASSGTITTSGVGEARVAPTANINGVILQAGTVAGQQVVVVNESAFSIQFAASGTSHVADGVADIIQANSKRSYAWDSSTSLWYGDTPVGQQSATAVVIAASGQIATAGISVSRVAPSAARASITMQAGTYAGQIVTVINESAAANTLTFNTTPATANVADSATEANIPGLTARTFVWDTSTALWYRCN